ncbi:MAG: GtrA family protein [Alphaproteobacteria bacterium]|nr:GtrA family protein [Alphaproteobacteria bacterium]
MNPKRLLRYAAVGAATALLYLGAIYLLKEMAGQPAVLAGVIAYAIAVAFNYTAHKTLTFEDGSNHRRSLPRYVVMLIGGGALNAAVLWLGETMLGDTGLLVQLAGMGLVILYNYAVMARFVFVSDAPD